jgi:hypothetical protein
MYTPEVLKSDHFYEHSVPSINKISNNNNNSIYPDHHADLANFQQTPMNVYNNYNPNFHHHYYYYPNNQINQAYPNSIEHNWIRKYDCENQKEYFIADNPSPTDFCDFEVPQQKSQPQNDHKSFSEFSFESGSLCKNNNNFLSENYGFWESEKSAIKRGVKSDEKCAVKNDDTKKIELKISKDNHHDDRGKLSK